MFKKNNPRGEIVVDARPLDDYLSPNEPHAMTLHLKIDTEKSLSMDEAKELLRQSEARGLEPSELALDYLRLGIREGSKPTAPETAAHVVDRTR